MVNSVSLQRCFSPVPSSCAKIWFYMSDYDLQKKKAYTQKLRQRIKSMPPFCGLYFRAMEDQTSILTRLGYAVDLQGFFDFCLRHVDAWKGKTPHSLTVSDLDVLTALDIECYLEEMTLYIKNDTTRENNTRAKARKLSAIRSFLKYYYKQQMITANVAALVDTPKLHDKAIIRLEANEVADLLDKTEMGDGLSKGQKKYHDATKVRDLAILTLFLGTGIRISELVGIDLKNIDFSSNAFVITRKGGNTETLTFGNEVCKALLNYLDERNNMHPQPGHENALFLSMQQRRITVRAVENLVKKYAAITTPLKKITPHKLRSTYGTMLYQESNDIYLVADVLGHKDVNTTRKHYAALSEEKRRTAAKMIKLREDPE